MQHTCTHIQTYIFIDWHVRWTTLTAAAANCPPLPVSHSQRCCWLFSLHCNCLLTFSLLLLLRLSLTAGDYVVAGKVVKITCNYLLFHYYLFSYVCRAGCGKQQNSIVGHQHDNFFWFSGLLMPTLALFVACAILWLLLIAEIILQIECDVKEAIKTMLRGIV